MRRKDEHGKHYAEQKEVGHIFYDRKHYDGSHGKPAEIGRKNGGKVESGFLFFIICSKNIHKTSEKLHGKMQPKHIFEPIYEAVFSAACCCPSKKKGV